MYSPYLTDKETKVQMSKYMLKVTQLNARQDPKPRKSDSRDLL